MKRRYQQDKNQGGQILVILLFFIAVTVIVTTAAVALMVINSTGASKLELSTMAYQVAESGAENALLRLLRNPSYLTNPVATETLPVGLGSATISITGTNPQTITSIGTYSNFQRTIVITVTVNNEMQVTSWREN
ncbi:MAG TPA: hypothetical protein VLH19_00750 [Patescibacteria group bacterium]|nr:hypothetical protein [Patescibacteria group bacterium]